MVSQLDIAPTIARVLGIEVSTHGRPIEGVECWGCRDVILIIADSYGWSLYFNFLTDTKTISCLVSTGRLYAVRSISSRTSPAIASILTGLPPKQHKITDTERARCSTLKSIVERASEAGLKTAVIMEAGGAATFRGLVDIERGVSKSLEPALFDEEICRETISALSLFPRLTVCHFLGLDRAAHDGAGIDVMKERALAIDSHVRAICKAARQKTLLIFCSDHPPHAGPFKGMGKAVPLILARL